MILIVSHRLDALRQTLFYNALDFIGSWCRINPSTWLLSTNRSPAEITAFLRSEINSEHLSAALYHSEDFPDIPPHAHAWVQSCSR
jgi:hypothetical protein